MKIKPKDGKTTKKVKDVKYHWCCHHKLWKKHKLEDCPLNPTNKNNGIGNFSSTFRQQPAVRNKERTPLTVYPGTTRRVTFTPASTIAEVHAEDEDF
jgi:hypothetical protein